MKNIKWIDDLKLRVGYGVTGNNNFSSTYMANMLGSDAYWLLPNGSWKKVSTTRSSADVSMASSTTLCATSTTFSTR